MPLLLRGTHAEETAEQRYVRAARARCPPPPPGDDLYDWRRGQEARADQHQFQPIARESNPLVFRCEMAREFGGMEQDDAASNKIVRECRTDREVT